MLETTPERMEHTFQGINSNSGRYLIYSHSQWSERQARIGQRGLQPHVGTKGSGMIAWSHGESLQLEYEWKIMNNVEQWSSTPVYCQFWVPNNSKSEIRSLVNEETAQKAWNKVKTKKGTSESVLLKVRIEPWLENCGRRRKIISYEVLIKEISYDCSTQSQSALALVLKKGYPENKD